MNKYAIDISWTKKKPDPLLTPEGLYITELLIPQLSEGARCEFLWDGGGGGGQNSDTFLCVPLVTK